MARPGGMPWEHHMREAQAHADSAERWRVLLNEHVQRTSVLNNTNNTIASQNQSQAQAQQQQTHNNNQNQNQHPPPQHSPKAVSQSTSRSSSTRSGYSSNALSPSSPNRMHYGAPTNASHVPKTSPRVVIGGGWRVGEGGGNASPSGFLSPNNRSTPSHSPLHSPAHSPKHSPIYDQKRDGQALIHAGLSSVEVVELHALRAEKLVWVAEKADLVKQVKELKEELDSMKDLQGRVSALGQSVQQLQQLTEDQVSALSNMNTATQALQDRVQQNQSQRGSPALSSPRGGAHPPLSLVAPQRRRWVPAQGDSDDDSTSSSETEKPQAVAQQSSSPTTSQSRQSPVNLPRGDGSPTGSASPLASASWSAFGSGMLGSSSKHTAHQKAIAAALATAVAREQAAALLTQGSEASESVDERLEVDTPSVKITEDEEGNKLINEYCVLHELGRGMFGKVKLAVHNPTDRLVAIKVMDRSLIGGVRSRTRLKDIQREIALMKRMRHPNIVALHEVMEDVQAGKLYLVLDYVERGAIRALTERGELVGDKMNEDEIRHVLCDVIQGLNYLHQLDIIHRDIKPENLLLSADNVVKIGDFGTAVQAKEARLVNTCQGTPAFQAPEIIRGDAAMDGPPVDVWALGVTIYTFYAGKVPFHGDSQPSMWQGILNGAPSIPDAASDEFKDLLLKMMEKDPKKRITLEGIAEHPFLRGLVKLDEAPSTPIAPSPSEVSAAVKIGSNMQLQDRIAMMVRMKRRVSRLLKHVRMNKTDGESIQDILQQKLQNQIENKIDGAVQELEEQHEKRAEEGEGGEEGSATQEEPHKGVKAEEGHTAEAIAQ